MPARSVIPAAIAGSIAIHAAALGFAWLTYSQSSSINLDLSNGASDFAPDGAVTMLWAQPAPPAPPAPVDAPQDLAPTPQPTSQVEVAAAPADLSPPTPAIVELELLPELAQELPQSPDPTPFDPKLETANQPALAPTSDTPSGAASALPHPTSIDPEAFRAAAAQFRQSAAAIASTLAAFRLPPHHAQTPASTASTNAAPSSPAIPGGQVSSPSPLSTNKAPPYPLEARRRHQQGTVTILIEVLPTGAVASVSIKTSSGFPLLDDAALGAAKNWHFSPATLENTPVHCQVTLPIEFSLRR